MAGSASAAATLQRACMSKGGHQGWHWGLRLQSAQSGRGTSVMTGAQAACRALCGALAGHIPGMWGAASEGGGGLAGLSEAGSGAAGSLPITCSQTLADTGHPEGPGPGLHRSCRLWPPGQSGASAPRFFQNSA